MWEPPQCGDRDTKVPPTFLALHAKPETTRRVVTTYLVSITCIALWRTLSEMLYGLINAKLGAGFVDSPADRCIGATTKGIGWRNGRRDECSCSARWWRQTPVIGVRASKDRGSCARALGAFPRWTWRGQGGAKRQKRKRNYRSWSSSSLSTNESALGGETKSEAKINQGMRAIEVNRPYLRLI